MAKFQLDALLVVQHLEYKFSPTAVKTFTVEKCKQFREPTIAESISNGKFNRLGQPMNRISIKNCWTKNDVNYWMLFYLSLSTFAFQSFILFLTIFLKIKLIIKLFKMQINYANTHCDVNEFATHFSQSKKLLKHDFNKLRVSLETKDWKVLKFHFIIPLTVYGRNLETWQLVGVKKTFQFVGHDLTWRCTNMHFWTDNSFPMLGDE